MKEHTLKIRKEAINLHNKLRNSYNTKTVQQYLLKNACITYCSLQQYATPTNNEYWEEVKQYIINKF